MPNVFVSNDDPSDFEPFDLPSEDILDGAPEARIHLLRNTEGPGAPVMSGIFTARPSTFNYRFEMNEAVHVLEGEADVEVGGETVSLRPGVIAAFPKGEVSTWRILSPFREFFVLSG